jgi:hypothetical protein
MTFDDDYESFTEKTTALAGHAVIDSHMDTVGTISYVLYDERELSPRWAVVKLGALRGQHFVPLADSYIDHDGRVVVPYEKTVIQRAPRARRAHMVDIRAARELRDYYGVAA